MRWFALLLTLTACDPGNVNPNAVPQDFACRVAQVAAGDVVLLACDGQGLIQVQAADIIAPDISAPACRLEAVLARSARFYAESLFFNAQSVRVLPADEQRGRRAARFVLDGQDFGQSMIASGYARLASEGEPDWCAIPRPALDA